MRHTFKPCSSVPVENVTLQPFSLWYRAAVSAITLVYRWPMWGSKIKVPHGILHNSYCIHVHFCLSIKCYCDPLSGGIQAGENTIRLVGSKFTVSDYMSIMA